MESADTHHRTAERALHRRRRRPVAGAALLLGAIASMGPAREREGLAIERVSRAELIAAMEAEQGYDPTKTTNSARFQGGVLLRLARQAVRDHPEGPLLFIDHEDWYEGFLKTTGLSHAEAPLFARLSRNYAQDVLFDYGPGRVVARVTEGPEPRLALSVTVWWQKAPDAPSSYSFVDELSVPTLRVTKARIIRYRVLEYDDMVVYDEIRGLTGRPTSGLLGALFGLIGDGRVVYSRSAISSDGLQLVHGRAEKGIFSVSSTLTVQPDGSAEKGLPAGREDLEAIEERLRQPLEVEYHPYPYDRGESD